MWIMLISLSVFKATQLLREFFEVPSWVLIVATVVLSTAGLWIAGENPGWGLAIAALAGFAHRADSLTQAVRDWVRVQVLSGGRRR